MLIIRRSISRFIFFIMGWKIIGSIKYPKRCVVIAAPHTSNWDFFIGRCYTYIIGISANYLIKSNLFLPIIGFFFRINGGIPVYREKKNNFVEQLIDRYQNKDNFILGIAPEGTRSRVDKWKTGFYHIAYNLSVPIILVKIDYDLKEVGIVKEILPSGNLKKDMQEIENTYRNVTAKIPEYYNPKIF